MTQSLAEDSGQQEFEFDRHITDKHMQIEMPCTQCDTGRMWLHQAKRICGHCGHAEQDQPLEAGES